MRFYQVEFYCSVEGHEGSEFFTSKSDAQRALRERGGKSDNNKPSGDDQIIPIDIEPTKAGILRALNDLATHENNG